LTITTNDLELGITEQPQERGALMVCERCGEKAYACGLMWIVTDGDGHVHTICVTCADRAGVWP
jgi:hypothetical protein